ncbi:MAG: hypothetical protein OD815_001069 [Candidatus Alkanophagales archaeon MCA70_species_2]|nr:hypothetical protein [Candidatus Alkanophaga liquidiphilum]
MNCVESLGHDPKPGDLGGGRVKRRESAVEARTGVDVQIARMTPV